MTTTGRGLAVIGPKLIYTEDGKHAYAYSGPIQVAGGAYTQHLYFQTGKSALKGTFTFTGPVLPANTPTGQLAIFRVKINDVIVFYIKLETVSEDMAGWAKIPFIIPPLSIVQVNAENGDSTADMVVGSMFIGKTV